MVVLDEADAGADCLAECALVVAFVEKPAIVAEHFRLDYQQPREGPT